MVRKTALAAGGLLYFAYVVAPIALLAVGSVGERWFGTLLPEGFTWEWYAKVFSQAMYYKAILTSLLVASLAVLVNAAVAIPAVYAVHVLGKRRLHSLMNFLVLLPIAVPPVVMGLGLVQAYNWDFFSLVGTWQLLLGAHAVYTLPFMVRPLMANIEMIGWQRLEEAGLSLGAGPLFMARKVLLPNLLPGLTSGALMTFAMSLGEFQLAVMVTSSASQTYPVVLYQAFYVGTGFACAATMVLVTMSLFTLLGVILLGRLFGTGGTQAVLGGGTS
ncbi:MAG: ABC transporter permease subunit [Synergistales bacterium]|nr:ABC transporter permease subunit [Synergistales bacterium]